MPIKKTLINLANTVKNQAQTKANQSQDRVVSGAATAASFLPYVKWIIAGVLIIVLIVILGSAASGFQNAAETLTRSAADCDPVPSDGEIDKYFTGQGRPLSEDQKSNMNRGKAGNGCKKQGSGFNGEAYPPTPGIVTEWFNAYRDGPPRYHQGMDIASSCDAPIYAFTGGEVVKVVMGTEARSSSESYAYPMGEIIIKHTESFSTRILHTKASTTTVKVGDIVSAGQQIATQWTNGPSTGCHLHIEAHVDGKAVDMNKFLADCGFVYNKEKSFNEFPEAPVMCGALGGTEAGEGGDIKTYAKSQMGVINGVSSSSVESEFQCLNNLWNRESNWRPTALNPAFAPSKSPIPENQAYGIAQAAPGSKMATEGADWKTNPQTQVRWGLKYIKDRYGTPCAAWAHSEAVNWY